MPIDPKQLPPYYNIGTMPTPPINPGIESIYRASLAQSGTNNPTATEDTNNTLTGITWTRGATGSYIGTKTGAFPNNKTYIQLTLNAGNTGISYQLRTTDNTVAILTWGVNGIAQDNIMQGATIQITITQ